MAELHYFPLLAGDWLSGEATTLMTPEQEGAFVHLLCHAWLTKHDVQCSLPDNDTDLAQMSRLGRRWKRVGALIKAQFKPVAGTGRLRNRKQWIVFEASLEKHQKRVVAGQRSAKARAEGKQSSNNVPTMLKQPLVNVSSNVLTKGQQSELEPYSESESTNYNPSPTALGAIAECFPGDSQAAFSMLAGMTNGIGTPGMKAVSVEVLQEAMAELRTSGGEITPHRFKSFVGKVLQRHSNASEPKAKSNGKGSTTRAMKLIGLIRQRRSPLYPNNVFPGWQEGLSPAEVQVCKTVGITRILNDANEGTMVAQLTRALEESA